MAKMKLFATEITALNSKGKLVRFGGPQIWASSFKAAKHYCETNNLGYCKVVAYAR